MEDGYKVVEHLQVQGDGHWSFYAVYDGHGSQYAMEWLQTHLHHFVADELQPLKVRNHPAVAAALKRAFGKADERLAAEVGAWYCGSTATVALLHDSPAGKELYVANVGDSKAVLIGGPDVQQLSWDHRGTNPLEESRVMHEGGFISTDEFGCKLVGGLLAVTRAFGDHYLKGGAGAEGRGVSCLPDVRSVKVCGSRALVLATDGLWDVLENADEAKAILEDSICQSLGKETLHKQNIDRLCHNAAQALVDYAMSRGSGDNICVLVALLDEAAIKCSPSPSPLRGSDAHGVSTNGLGQAAMRRLPSPASWNQRLERDVSLPQPLAMGHDAVTQETTNHTPSLADRVGSMHQCPEQLQVRQPLGDDGIEWKSLHRPRNDAHSSAGWQGFANRVSDWATSLFSQGKTTI